MYPDAFFYCVAFLVVVVLGLYTGWTIPYLYRVSGFWSSNTDVTTSSERQDTTLELLYTMLMLSVPTNIGGLLPYRCGRAGI